MNLFRRTTVLIHQHAGVQLGVFFTVAAASGSGARVRQALHLKPKHATETSTVSINGNIRGGAGGVMTAARQSRKGPSSLMSVCGSRNSRRKQCRYNYNIPSSDLSFVNRQCNIRNPVNIVKNPLCISTWNVTSLVSNSSKMYQLEKGFDEYGLELLGVTETHMPGSGTQSLGNGAILIHSGRSDGVRREGVAVVLSKKMKNALISYSPVSERVMTARLHSKHINISVTVVYAPTEDAESSKKDEFYRELNDVQSGLPMHDIKLVIGDFNARVGRDSDSYPGVIGKHSYHTESNDNGKRMLDFCTMHQLTIGGTLFEHKDIHKTTWRSPNGHTVTQIDHVCISKRWSHSLLDVRSMRGADINTTHYLVRGYLSVKLKCPQKRKKGIKMPALELLRDRSKSQEYSNKIAEKYYKMDETSANIPLEDQWKNLRDSVTEVSFEVLGERGRKKKTEHLSRETKELIKERGEIRKKPSTDINRREYSRINGLVRQSCKKDDNCWAARVAEELEDAAKQGQQREVWQKIRTLTNRRTNRAAAVRDKNGSLIPDPEAQAHRWAEYFEELLTPAAGTTDFSLLDSEEEILSFDYLSDDDEPPSIVEIEEAIKKLKNYKSAGIDDISNEQLKYGAPGILPWLRSLFEAVWNSEDVPSDWRKGIITIIPKKGDLSYCNNNRGITLRSTASKLFQIVLLQRLNAGLEKLLRESQCGFRRNRSCIDQLYSLHCIIHNCIEFNLPLYINFIDFKAAFDSINRDFIWKAFKHYGLPTKYINIFKAFFRGTESAVRVNGELTRWFYVDSGTGQGDVQGPPIFNLVINWGLELAEKYKNISRGLTLQRRQSSRQPEKCVVDLDYADDIAAMDDSPEGLQETTDNIAKYCGIGGLRMNAKKTESMVIGKDTSQHPLPKERTLSITVDGNPVKQVTQFTYLGATISSDGKLDKEISVRIGKATGAFNQLNNVWKNQNISIKNKMRIYVAAVLTILTYGCEVWNTTQIQNRRLETFHQYCLRRILRVRWFHKVRNEVVLERASISALADMVATKRLRWFGHVSRMPEERLPNYLLDWKPRHGKRSRGRPRKTLNDVYIEDAERILDRNGLTIDCMKGLAEDRKGWRSSTRRNCMIQSDDTADAD